MIRLQRFIPFLLMTLIVMAGCTKDSYDFGSLPPTVKSYFSVSSAEVDMNEQIQFTNLSEDADSYEWSFGDGTKSSDLNPSKSYAESGVYTVTLKAVGAGGTGNYSIDILVIDPSQVGGSFSDLFYIDYGNKMIKQISLEPGSSSDGLVDISGRRGVGIVYDSLNEKIYYTDFEDTYLGKVWRMNIDGSEMEEIVTDIDDPYSIVIDLNGGKVYWGDDAGNLSRCNLDGSGLEREFVHIDGGQMRGVAFDSRSNVVYFYEVNDEDIYVVKTDGTGLAKLISGTYGYGLLVDEVNDKLYYDDRRGAAIMKVNLDGSGAEKIADAPGTRIHGMAIDYKEDKFYWTDRDDGKINRANLDGTGREAFMSNLSSPRGIFIK